jgi:ubiquinone/menaquinone biosynthesis C-methylase UbiE
MTNTHHHNRWKRSGLRAYNGKWAVAYDSCLWWKVFSAQSMDSAVVEQLGLINTNLHVLDIGCATGRLLESLVRGGLNNLYGMDIAPRIIRTAQRRLTPFNKDIDLRVGDAEEKITWPDSSFDVVTVTGVLHHLTKPKSALKEIYRVLKHQGRLIVIDPCFFPPVRHVINLFLKIHPFNGDFHFYSAKRATDLLTKCHFKNVICKPLSWHMFIVVSAKF